MEYVEPSNAAAFYLKHVEAMKAVVEQPEGKSFAVVKEGYSLALFRDLAELANVGKKAFVVIEWPEAFEVQRLPDGSNTKLFYRYLAGSEKPQPNANDALDKTREAIEAYKLLSVEECLKYDNKLTQQIKNDSLISYTYLQRRLASVAAFKNSSVGSTEKLKECIDSLIEEDLLKEFPKGLAKEAYDTSAKLYKINAAA